MKRLPECCIIDNRSSFWMKAGLAFLFLSIIPLSIAIPRALLHGGPTASCAWMVGHFITWAVLLNKYCEWTEVFVVPADDQNSYWFTEDDEIMKAMPGEKREGRQIFAVRAEMTVEISFYHLSYQRWCQWDILISFKPGTIGHESVLGFRNWWMHDLPDKGWSCDLVWDQIARLDLPFTIKVKNLIPRLRAS